MHAILSDFSAFIQKSPSSFHAAKCIGTILAEKDFEPLDEKKNWEMEKERSYFTIRDHAALIAFTLPKKTPKKAVILASHLDSPTLKLKPGFTSPSNVHAQLAVEIYGGPILSAWLNRDLGIAGKIYTNRGAHLVTINHIPLMIPQIAIHLEREMNSKGVVLNKQEQLKPLIALESFDLEKWLKKEYGFDTLYDFDLFLYPLEEPRFLGPNSEMLASYRIDNLSSAYASMHSMIFAKDMPDDTLAISVFWDHEEVGSKTQTGAESTYLLDTIRRIASFYRMGAEEFFILKNRSLAVSIDVAHGFDPNYSDKYDAQFSALLGKGTALKYNAQQKYTTNAETGSQMLKMAKKAKVPLQRFSTRNDLSSGSTVAPCMAASLSMPTVDIGIPILSMHSTREILSCKDFMDLCHLTKTLLEEY